MNPALVGANDVQFSALDRALVECLERHSGPFDGLARLAIAACSNAVTQGHSCLPLAALASGFVESEAAFAQVAWPRDKDVWQSALLCCPAIGAVGSDAALILHEGRLYLRRYFEYERQVAAGLLARARQATRSLPTASVAARLAELFGYDDAAGTDWQKAATALALRQKLTIILGGPGSGKTYTVLRLLAALLEFSEGAPPRIVLAAPTGKAAARVAEALRADLLRLDLPSAAREQLPSTAMTLHRLLGIRPYSTHARYDADTRLPYEVVVVDECSMVDLPSMAQLLAALPEHAQLILLGDPDQLASVEAGSVLAELRSLNPHNIYRGATAQWLTVVAGIPAPGADAPPSAIADCIVTLRGSRRFAAGSGIATLTAAVRDGDSDSALRSLDEQPSLTLRALPQAKRLRGALAERCQQHLAIVEASADAASALRALQRFRILAARREGLVGVSSINQAIVRANANAVDGRRQAIGAPYLGMPVLVTANDYSVGLFNGDVGVYWPLGPGDDELRIWFADDADPTSDIVAVDKPRQAGAVRDLLPAQLPTHEVCYAMTVHKAQGSEFDRVLLLLPNQALLGLSREWLYTALSRARESIEIWGDAETLRAIIGVRAQRWSGLGELLSHASDAQGRAQ